MRTYHLADRLGGGITLRLKNDKDCILCTHCQCLWDYTNGPYMFFCDLGRSECNEAGTPEEHTCELFEEGESK